MGLDVASADIFPEIVDGIGRLDGNLARGNDRSLAGSENNAWQDRYVGGKALENAAAVVRTLVLAVLKLPAAEIYGRTASVLKRDVFLVRLVSIGGVAGADGNMRRSV